MDSAAFLPITETPASALMMSDIEQRKRHIRRIVAFTLWGVGFITLLVASVIVHFHPGPWPFDLQTTVTLQSLHLWPWVNSSIDFVSRLNDPLPVTVALVFWLVGLSLFRWFLPAIFFVFGTVIADLGINAFISQLVGRPRPSSPLIHIYNPEPFYSFPSGHTEHNVVYYGFLLFLSFTKPVRHWRYRWILLPFQIFAVLNILGVGYSRVEEGSHWITDIFGGYLSGALCLFLLIFLYRQATDLLPRWRTKRQMEKSIQVHDEPPLAAKQGPKSTPGTETLGERIEEDTERVVEEVQQEVAVAKERIEEGTERVVEEAKQEVVSARRPWYQSKRWGSVLLVVLATFLVLFGLLAWWVASHPILAIDVMITHDFQESQAPWLRITMIAVSYIGNMPLLSIGLIAMAAALFWMVDLRLEAITIVVISATSALLEWLVKLTVARPRPSASLVEVIQAASGKSFPSGHVMSYIALWGLLFCFCIILFRRKYWWRTALLVLSALLVVLVGPSRVYLGDHWASDVLGSYLLSGFLLGVTLWIYLYLKGRNALAPRGHMAERLRKYMRR